MSDNKRYYYLKFKENYFEQDHIRVIEGMKDGHLYSNILLKLYLKSLKFDGQLRINEKIPYRTDNIDFLASAINHDSANVMHAINLAKELGVIEVLDTGEIFMADIQDFIGHGSTEGERKAKYRAKLAKKQSLLIGRDNVPPLPDKRPPELEIELEKELDIKKKKKFIKPTKDQLLLYAKEINFQLDADRFLDYYETVDWKIGKSRAPMKNWKAAVRTWQRNQKDAQPEKRKFNSHIY